ncbi:hypothetical protein B0H13DRAFT_1851920 [Mycena leptocephala]|nr:hypothetical protein B0H13DRAFT_1851920 [Mycena leptocephala]
MRQVISKSSETAPCGRMKSRPGLAPIGARPPTSSARSTGTPGKAARRRRQGMLTAVTRASAGMNSFHCPPTSTCCPKTIKSIERVTIRAMSPDRGPNWEARECDGGESCIRRHLEDSVLRFRVVKGGGQGRRNGGLYYGCTVVLNIYIILNNFYYDLRYPKIYCQNPDGWWWYILDLDIFGYGKISQDLPRSPKTAAMHPCQNIGSYSTFTRDQNFELQESLQSLLAAPLARCRGRAQWATIEIECPREKEADFSQLIELWFARAGIRALSVSVHADPHLDDLDPRICAVVHRHADRVQNLKLYLHSEDLKRMNISFPSLEFLTIGQGPATEGTCLDDSLDFAACIGLLCAGPKLAQCTFDRVYFEGQHSVRGLSCHPTLRRLYLGDGKRKQSSADMLRYLTLPSLESLRISDYDIDHDEFLRFLGRSSPSLHSLYMRIPSAEWSAAQLDSVCRLLPSLTRLEIDFALSEQPGQIGAAVLLLDLLADSSPRVLLPNLNALAIKGTTPDHSQYQQLATTLSTLAHQPRLQTFRLVTNVRPQSEIIAMLRALVANVSVGVADSHLGILKEAQKAPAAAQERKFGPERQK